MPSTWTVRLMVAVPVAITVILAARTYMKNRRVDYWTLAEDANKPNDRDAHMRILFVGNSFIHYNGGAEKVLLREHPALRSHHPAVHTHCYACVYFTGFTLLPMHMFWGYR